MPSSSRAARLIVSMTLALVASACDKGGAGGAEAKGDEGEAKTETAKADEAKAGGSAASEVEVAAPFSFTVEASNGMTWSDESPKAYVKMARPDYLQLKATGFSVRVMANKLPDAGPAETDDLNRNNTFLHFKTEIEGKKMMIGCHPAKRVTGTLKRTKLDDSMVEGNFEFELVECNDYMTGKPIAYDGVPFTAKGSFSVPLSK